MSRLGKILVVLIVLAAGSVAVYAFARNGKKKEGGLKEIEVVQVLGLASVPAARPLRELGFDSIMAVELRDRIASLIERPVPATLVFDHPTLERQVRFLLQLCGLLETLDAAPDATRREAAQFESIAQLSDQEAIAALQSRLHDISEQLE